MSALLVADFALPAFVGVTICLLGRRAARWAPVVSIATAVLTLAIAVVVAFARPKMSVSFVTNGNFGLRVDGLAAVMLPTVASISVLVLVFAAANRIAPTSRFHGLMLVFVSAVIVTTTASTLPALLVAWEVMGATSYALIGFRWQEPRRVAGGLIALLVTRCADLGLYLAAGAALAGGHSLAFDRLANLPAPWIDVLAAGILVAGLGKAAQLPFSFWISRAMEGPSPVSALLHSAAMVAMGGYLLLRLHPALSATAWADTTTAWIGVTTAIALGLVALAQRDLKQLLAASTAAQIGFVVLAAGVGSIAGGAGQLVAHAVTKALLFLVAGAWLTATGTKQLESLRGVRKRWRGTAIVFCVGALSLAGIPPLPLWFSKDTILAAAAHASPALYGAGLIAAVLSAAYAAKILSAVWSFPGAPNEAGWDAESEGSRRVTRGEFAPIAVLGAATVILAAAVLPPVTSLFHAILGVQPVEGATPLELIVSGILSTLVAVLVFRRSPPPLRWLENWLHLEKAAVLLVAQPTLALSRSLAAFDQHLDGAIDRVAGAVLGGGSVPQSASRVDSVIDRFVDRTGAVLLSRGGVALGTADFDRVVVDGSISATVVWFGRIGRAARTIQSGRISDYYVLVTIVLAVLAAVLVFVR